MVNDVNSSTVVTPASLSLATSVGASCSGSSPAVWLVSSGTQYTNVPGASFRPSSLAVLSKNSQSIRVSG